MKNKPKIVRTVMLHAVWVIMLAISHPSLGQQAWSLQPETAPVVDGHFTSTTGMCAVSSPKIIYQVGTLGMIRKKEVTGDWINLNSGGTAYLRDVVFFDQFLGWVVGDGVILRTTDKGVTWTTTNFSGINFYAIGIGPSSTLWAVGTGGAIYTSNNMGVSWTPVTSNTTATLNDIWRDGNTMIAVGNSGTICRSTNSGGTWSVSTIGNSSLLGIDGTSSMLIAVGAAGTILKSTNSGQTWTNASSGTTQTLTDVANYGSTLVAVGNAGTILKTTNGTSWTQATTGFTETLNAIISVNILVAGAPVGEFWAIGNKGTYYSTTQNEACSPPGARTSSSNNDPRIVSSCVGGSATLNAYDYGTIGTRIWKKNGTAFIYNSSSSVHPQAITLNNLQSSDAGIYTMEVSSLCGNATTATFTLSVNLPQQPSVIVGPGGAAQNVPTNYSVSPIAGATFSWNAGSGGTVIGSGNSVQLSWSTTGSKTVSVTATDVCGNSIARNATVIVASCTIPAQPSTISLTSGSECPGSSATYSVTNVAGVNYAWTVNGGETITGNGNNATVVWSTSGGPYSILVTPSSNCGNGTSRSLLVTIGAPPAQPSVISGSTTVCTGVSIPYSVTNVAGVTYVWNTGGAGTITGSGNSISVIWTSTGVKTLTVTPSASCGNGAVRTLAVTVNAVPAQPSVISGSTAVTTGTTNQFSVTNESGVTYSWNAGTGGTVTGSGNVVNISWSSAGSKTITLTPSNGCGNGTTRTLSVTASDCAVPTQPSTITGSATACTIASGAYSVTSVGGVTYNWNAGTDGSVSGSGNSVTLSWTSVGTKTVTVTPSNTCGNGTARTLSVTVSQLPAPPSAITGNTTPCKNASGAYSIINVAGVTYTWDIMGTGTITGSGNSINVTWTATGSHTLRVTPSNGCGAGVSTTLAVTVNDVPLAASQMTGLTAVCSGNSIPYSVGNLAGVTYTWSGGSGSTVTGSGSAVSISWATGGTKTVSVTPSNACGNGTASTKTVEVSTIPAQPSTIVGSTAAVGGIAQSYSVTNTSGVTYTWSTNADGVVASTGNTAQVTWATTGLKTLTVTPSNLCGNGIARSLTVTTTVPCTIPGTPSSMTIGLGGSANIALNDFRRFVVGASSGSTSLNIAVSPSTGTTITPVFGNTWDIVFTIPGTYTVSGFGEISGCGAGAPVNVTVIVCTGTVADPTAISGPLLDVCRGTTTRYSVTSTDGVVFDWSLSGFSGTITPLNADRSTVDVAWSTAAIAGDVLTVRAKNSCNVLSGSFSESVFFKLKPSYAGFGLSLTGSVCAGSGGGLLMSIGLPESATTYTWQLNGAGTVAGDNLSASALADGLSRQIKIYGTNACFKDEFIDAIDYGGGSPIPVTPSPVSGPSTINVNTDGTYSVDAQPAGINFSWDAGSDATITAGASANIKNIQWSTGGLKTVFVNAVNTCGDGYRSYSVFVNGPCVAPSVPGTISGSTTVCVGVEYQYSVPFQSFDAFNWSAGADATITGSGSLRTIKWSTGGSKTISVTATNLCTTSTASTLGVTVNAVPSQPVTLTGSASGCNGTTQQISLAPPVAGVTYTWEVQGGTFVTSGVQGQIADITWTSLGINQVKLKPSNACGNGTSTTLDVTLGTVPDQPSLITGESEVCSSTSKTYSVTNVPGVTYLWNAGSGGTVTGNGNSVSISWSTTGSKTIILTPSNSCGSGTARALTVNVKGVPAQPATISGVVSPVLGDEQAYSVTSVTGVNYTWSLSDKGIITGTGNSSSVLWNIPGSATLSVIPSNTCGTGTARTASITINKISQAITFTITSPILANQSITLNGTASSGLPITYASSNTSIVEIFGSELIIKSSGTIDVTGSQSGDGSFAAASPVLRSLTINRASQVITFNTLPAAAFGQGDIELDARSNSNLPVTYSSSNSSVAAISGNSLAIVGAGAVNITAIQGGDAIFNSATSVVRALTVNKADQTILFESLVAKGVSDPPFSLSASASSRLAVSYSSSNTAVATVSGSNVTIVGQGTSTITAAQTGNTNYNAATPVDQVLTVNDKQSQVITFGELATKTFGDVNFSLVASSSSGGAVLFTSSNTDVATISGSTVTIVSAGSSTITATQSGDATYNPAAPIQQTLVVNKANQTISFNAIGSKQLSDGSFELQATSSSGLPISFTSSNASVATVSGTTVTLLSAGETTITAIQAGNENFNSATVDRVLTVIDKQSQTISFAVLPTKIFGDATFNLSATSTSGLVVSFASSNTAVVSVVGNQVTIIGAGTTIITATQSGDATFAAAISVQQSLIVNKANQTIMFGVLEQKIVGASNFNLTASTTSGLAIAFSSSNANVATISGNTITIVGAGSTTITASQSGNPNYEAANSIDQTLIVNPQTRIISLGGSMAFGQLILPESATKQLTISNTGNTTLSITNIIYPAGYSGDKTNGSITSGGTLIVNVMLTPTEPKEYTGNIEVISNSTSGTSTIAVSGTSVMVTGIEPNAVTLLSAYPNPSTGVFIIEVAKPTGNKIMVSDLMGKISESVSLEWVGDNRYQFNISHQSEGVYILKVQTEYGVKLVRVVKNN